MQYKKVGSFTISRIGLGTWAIGDSGWDRYNENESIKALETAIDNGINFIDTAPIYGFGKAEELIGGVIKGKRDSVILATKCGLPINERFRIDLSPEFIEKDLAGSLERLRTDYIDLYQCHWPDQKTPIEKTMTTLMKFREQGKIRAIGVSNFNREQIQKATEYADILTVQPHYSLLEREVEKEIQNLCIVKNIAMIPYGSLGSGILTGKYIDRPRFPKRDPRTFFYTYYNEKNWPIAKTLVDEINSIASEKGVYAGHLAITWLLSRSAVAVALVGARNPKQARENCKASDLVLSSADIDKLTVLSDKAFCALKV